MAKKGKKEKKEKKDKKEKKEKKSKKKNDIEKRQEDANNFVAPIPFKFLPPPMKAIIKHFKEVGYPVPNMNIRIVNEDELDTLPTEFLSQILDKAVADENWELATKVRDILNKNK